MLFALLVAPIDSSTGLLGVPTDLPDTWELPSRPGTRQGSPAQCHHRQPSDVDGQDQPKTRQREEAKGVPGSSMKGFAAPSRSQIT